MSFSQENSQKQSGTNTAFKNLCAYHKEEVLRIPKHPQLAKFGLF